MALIKCPECGKEISDKSSACIHCGYPLANIQQEKPKVIQTQSAENSVQSLQAKQEFSAEQYLFLSALKFL